MLPGLARADGSTEGPHAKSAVSVAGGRGPAADSGIGANGQEQVPGSVRKHRLHRPDSCVLGLGRPTPQPSALGPGPDGRCRTCRPRSRAWGHFAMSPKPGTLSHVSFFLIQSHLTISMWISSPSHLKFSSEPTFVSHRSFGAKNRNQLEGIWGEAEPWEGRSQNPEQESWGKCILVPAR